MHNYISKLNYYIERGGINAIMTVLKRHITKKKYLFNREFYKYFEALTSDMYRDELKLQLKVLKNSPYDIDNPKTFNEKIQWLKIHDSTPLKIS